MGNFHGIPESCVTVEWREYLPPVVRWRYGEGEWNEIEGDDSNVEQKNGQCPGVLYSFKVEYSYFAGAGIRNKNLNLYGPINGTIVEIRDKATYLGVLAGTSATDPTIKFYQVDVYPTRFSPFPVHRIVDLARNDGQPDDCGECEFSITKDGAVIYEETRAECPEVEILPCRLSDEVKQVKIKKIPYLSWVDVIDFARDAQQITGVPYPVPTPRAIPDNCLNIYRMELYDPLPSGKFPEPNDPVFGDFIVQICSASGCPPPQYTVIDDCDGDDCESCPDGTCAIECGDRICCYGDDGIAVKSIPLANYCGG